MVQLHEGGCVCKAVRYRTHGDPARVTVCHCSWCQRRTGSAFGVGAVFERAKHELLAVLPKTYRHTSDESGRWLDLHFCPSCGTNIGFTLEWVPGIFAVDAGTFDDPSWIDPTRHDFRYIYMSSARCWSRPPDGALRYDEHFRA